MTQVKKDEVFRKENAGSRDFEFTEEVAEVFDDMLARSVPFYHELQTMMKDMAKRFFTRGTNVYDLGCSTGTTLVDLALEFGDQAKQFIGYDNSYPMMEKAREQIKGHQMERLIKITYADLNAGVLIQNASVVTMCWTLQFIRPLQRDNLIRQIHQGLVENGVLLVTEKILTDNTDTNRLFIELYYEFKKKQGYSDEEISRKRESLENILIPYKCDENLELFKRNGFKVVETFFQWYNWAGFLCVKRP